MYFVDGIELSYWMRPRQLGTKCKTSASSKTKCAPEDAPFDLKFSANSLRFCAGFFAARILLFKLLLQLFTLLGASVSTLLSLLVQLMFSTEQLDESHLGSIALASACASDPRVAASARSIARRYNSKETVNRLRRHQVSSSLTASMHITTLAQRDHLLDNRTSSLALRDRGLDPVHHDDGGYEVAEDGPAMARVTSQFVSCIAVAHSIFWAGAHLLDLISLAKLLSFALLQFVRWRLVQNRHRCVVRSSLARSEARGRRLRPRHHHRQSYRSWRRALQPAARTSAQAAGCHSRRSSCRAKGPSAQGSP